MEFDQVVVKDGPGLCRCCLSEGCYKDLGAEYSWMSETEVYADMLLECFDISISQHNDGPNGPKRLVCEVCITRLRDACNFKKQVQEAEHKFVDMLAKGEFKSKVLILESNMKSEVLNDDQDDKGHVEYLEVDYMNDGDYVDDDMLGSVDDASVSNIEETPTPKKRGRPRKTPKEVKKTKVTKLETKSRASKAVAKGAKLEDKCTKMERARKQSLKQRNIEYVLQYSNATPFLWYKGKYRCFFCVEPMKTPNILREHTANVHQFANLELVVHDRTKNNRNKDGAVKIDITDLSCKLCSSSMNNLEELIHHLIIAHDAEYNVNVPNCLLPFKLDKDHPTCPTCDMQFVFFEYLLRHANKHHLSHDYICDVCGTSFQGENHLKMHNRYYHREGGYNCEYCDVNLPTISKKILHEKNVHLVNLSSCPHCTETFKSPYLKKLHLANVHGIEELKIKCPYCPKVYPQESIMSRHMRRVHLKEKNVECEVCGDKFFSTYDLKLHMVKHNGEKKFVCTVCGQRFSKKSNLNCHSVLHTGERKYECAICNKTFAHQSNLKVHLKNQHHPVVSQNIEGEEVVQLELVNDDLVGAELYVQM